MNQVEQHTYNGCFFTGYSCRCWYILEFGCAETYLFYLLSFRFGVSMLPDFVVTIV